MSQFRIRTVDSAYDYSDSLPATVKQSFKTNLQTSDTQGFMIKRQAGRQRVELTLNITGTKSAIEAQLLPQLNYPSDSFVTIDRNILGKSTATMRAVISEYDVREEFADGNEMSVDLTCIEVLGA